MRAGGSMRTPSYLLLDLILALKAFTQKNSRYFYSYFIGQRKSNGHTYLQRGTLLSALKENQKYLVNSTHDYHTAVVNGNLGWASSWTKPRHQSKLEELWYSWGHKFGFLYHQNVWLAWWDHLYFNLLKRRISDDVLHPYNLEPTHGKR